jgi:crotonobetainyl-CoA:carnitine CoA-transferase CaiB-like acyl-CoA transferase
MVKALEGIKIVEVGGAGAMPLAGMLMASWGAEVIHVEPPGRGDIQREIMSQGVSGWVRQSKINYLWEHVNQNKKSIAVNIGTQKGQKIVYQLIASADIFLNNLRPYEMEKFNLSYEHASKINPKLIYANLTGYGTKGPEKNAGGFDSVAFWARSGVMELMHESETAPNISRPAYGDSITSISLLAGILGALFVREHTGIGQEVQVSLYNTATWVLGFDITSCLITGQDTLRPERRKMPNPIRNIYPTKDKRWIMLGMTNAQHYWPTFCKAIGYPELEKDPKFTTMEARGRNAEELVEFIESTFRKKTYSEWIEILSKNKLVWSPVLTPLEVTRDDQALANEFFVEIEHSRYGKIRMLNNPIKLSKTPAEFKVRAPDLGEHNEEVLKKLGYSSEEMQELKVSGIIG